MASDCEPISDPSDVDLKHVFSNSISEAIYHCTLHVNYGLQLYLILIAKQLQSCLSVMDRALSSRCSWHLVGGLIKNKSACFSLLFASVLMRFTALTCSFSPPLCRRSWSRAPSETLRAWEWRRLNMGTRSASSCTWPQDSGSPTRHLMSNLPVWVP